MERFFTVPPGSVAVLALERFEQGGGIIVGAQERSGVAAECTVDSAAFEIKHRARVGPWEVKTLVLEPEGG